MKIKTLLIFCFLILTACVIAYLDYGIRNYGLQFHQGKDGGYFMRFESIVLLSTAFYILNAIRPQGKIGDYLIYGLTGFIIGIGVAFSCYILLPLDDSGLTYHIVSISICYLSVYVLRKLKRMITKKGIR
jgi:hypothetical protein